MQNPFELLDKRTQNIENIALDLMMAISRLEKNFQPKEPTEYLTRNEVAELLKCDLSTIWLWTKKGKIISYGIGNRVYYKRSEVENAMVRLFDKKFKHDE